MGEQKAMSNHVSRPDVLTIPRRASVKPEDIFTIQGKTSANRLSTVAILRYISTK